MKLELHGERVVLRVCEERHAPIVLDYYTRNTEHFQRWDPARPKDFYRIDWWRERLAGDHRAAADDRGYRFFVFPRGSDDLVIAHAQFSNVVRGAFHSCHLGYSIDHAHEGRGLMRESLELAIAWAFEVAKLHRIEANYRPENVRSGGLLKRLGFTPQGFARDYLRIDGEWRDHVLTARINDRWSG